MMDTSYKTMIKKIDEIISALNAYVLYDTAPDCENCIKLLSSELENPSSETNIKENKE